MSYDDEPDLKFYMSAPAPCVYLSGRTEQKIFLPCGDLMGGGLPVERAHSKLVQLGFRRNNEVVYRPNCPDCQACESIRVLIAKFKPSRRMRRISHLNRDICLEIGPARATYEQFDVFHAYQQARHNDGEMAQMDYEAYKQMVEVGNGKSGQLLLRNPSGELLSVMLYDDVEDGLSATYSFFAPDEAWRSLGVYMVLSLIEFGKALKDTRQQIRYIYLGYYIADCRKMAYKIEYQPCEVFRNGLWQEIAT